MSLPSTSGNPLPPAPPTRKSGCLRVMIWLLPSVVVPMCMAATIQAGRSNYGFYVGAAISLGLTIYLGHFNAMLRCQQRGIPQDHPKAAIGANMLIFVMLQLLVVPALWFGLFWGFCMLAGGGKF